MEYPELEEFITVFRVIFNKTENNFDLNYTATDKIRFMNDSNGYMELGATAKVEVLACTKDPPPPPVRPPYIPPDDDCQAPPVTPQNTTVLAPCGLLQFKNSRKYFKFV